MSAQHDWERRETPEGTPYWVNHTTQTTQWEAPPPPPYSAAPHAQPVAAVAAGPPPVVVQAQPVAQPAAVPVVSSTVVAPPARPAQPAVTSSSSGNVAYQPPRGPPVATPAEPQKRGSMSAFFSRAQAAWNASARVVESQLPRSRPRRDRFVGRLGARRERRASRDSFPDLGRVATVLAHSFSR